ncbi:hypothetical protein F8M41_014296 [Gigaspora margarita]|uniref:Uncharacterized protein n=1 Tax=Gigaspora margarita TaxID=4874 RepID=A0A8H4ENV4_GIGMA|nr:hypothetical protein F8M41_014296 [Gigaspora margarita]
MIILLTQLIIHHRINAPNIEKIAIRRTQSVISEEHEKETITCAWKLVAVILTLIFDELMNRAYLTSPVIYASVDAKIRKLREKRKKTRHKIHELPPVD